MVMMEAYSRPTYDIVFQWIWFQLKIFPISDLGPSLRRRSVKAVAYSTITQRINYLCLGVSKVEELRL